MSERGDDSRSGQIYTDAAPMSNMEIKPKRRSPRTVKAAESLLPFSRERKWILKKSPETGRQEKVEKHSHKIKAQEGSPFPPKEKRPHNIRHLRLLRIWAAMYIREAATTRSGARLLKSPVPP